MSVSGVIRASAEAMILDDQFGPTVIPQIGAGAGGAYNINPDMSVGLTVDGLLPIDPSAEGLGFGLTGTFKYDNFFADASWARYHNDDTFSLGGRYQFWEGLSAGARVGWIEGNGQNPAEGILSDDYVAPSPRQDLLLGIGLAYDFF